MDTFLIHTYKNYSVNSNVMYLNFGQDIICVLPMCKRFSLVFQRTCTPTLSCLPKDSDFCLTVMNFKGVMDSIYTWFRRCWGLLNLGEQYKCIHIELVFKLSSKLEFGEWNHEEEDIKMKIGFRLEDWRRNLLWFPSLEIPSDIVNSHPFILFVQLTMSAHFRIVKTNDIV